MKKPLEESEFLKKATRDTVNILNEIENAVPTIDLPEKDKSPEDKPLLEK